MSICLAISADVGSRPSTWDQLPRRANQLVEDLDHVHWEADGARLIGNGSGDCLANPPRRNLSKNVAMD
jgi:hypothetical protein